MATPPTETQPNPHQAMSSFITSLQTAGMDEAATQAQNENKEAAPVVAKTEPGAANPAPVGVAPAARKTPETPAVPKPTDAQAAPVDSESEEEKWPRSASDWEKRKQVQKEKLSAAIRERDTIKTERDKLNTEIATLRKSGPSPELDKVTKERDELSDRLRIVAVEQHPKFKAYFDGKTTEQLELAKDIIGADKAGEIVELLKQPDSQWRREKIEQATAEMGPLQQAQIGSVITELSRINRERQGAIAGARETYDKMVKEQQDNATKQATELRGKLEGILSDALTKVQDAKTGIAAFQTKTGDDEWNREVETRIATAKNMLTGTVKPEEAMDVMLLGIAAPAVLKSYQSALEENAKLQAQIKELSSATPTVAATSSGGSGEAAPSQAQIKPGMGPHEAIKAWMAGNNIQQ